MESHNYIINKTGKFATHTGARRHPHAFFAPHILNVPTYVHHVNSIVTDLVNAFPGNSSVNTAQHATIDKAVFLCRLRYAQRC
jgi:hypothetical protein